MKRAMLIFIVLAWTVPCFGANIVAKEGFYKTGTSANCSDATGWTAGDLEDASTAAGVSGTVVVCEGTYTDSELGDSGGSRLDIQANSQTWTVNGTVNLVATDSTEVIDTNGKTGCSFTGFTITTDNQATSYGIYIDGANTNVENCTIIGPNEAACENCSGIYVSAAGSTLTNNTIYYTERGIYIYGAAGAGFTGTIDGGNFYDLSSGDGNESDGISFNCNNGGAVCDFNGFTVGGEITIYNYEDDGIDLYAANNVAIGSAVGDFIEVGPATGNGVKMGGTNNGTGSDGNSIERFYIHNVDGHGITGNNAKGWSSINGKVVDVGVDGIRITDTADTGPGDPIIIYYVDVYNAGDDAIDFNDATVVGTVQNCILDGTDNDMEIGAGITVTGGYNCFVNDAAKGGTGTYTDVGASTLFQTDPLYVDAANNNFNLQPDSPCINAGLDVSVTYDLEERTRGECSVYTIGAYLFGDTVDCGSSTVTSSAYADGYEVLIAGAGSTYQQCTFLGPVAALANVTMNNCIGWFEDGDDMNIVTAATLTGVGNYFEDAEATIESGGDEFATPSSNTFSGSDPKINTNYRPIYYGLRRTVDRRSGVNTGLYGGQFTDPTNPGAVSMGLNLLLWDD